MKLIHLYIFTFKSLILTLILMSQFTQSAPIRLTVGSDDDCNFQTIQEAVDSGTVNMDIRVTNQQDLFSGVQIIDGNDVSFLRGGYANCANAFDGIIDDENPYTNILDLNGNDVLYIFKNNVSHYSLNISGFKLQNGITGVYVASGVDNETLTIGFNSVEIFNNSFSGVQIYGTGSEVNFNNTKIYNNENSTNGGGVYCFESVVNLGENVAIFDNMARRGAGIYAQKCTVTLQAGDNHPMDEVEWGVYANNATDSGAGIYLSQANLIGFGTLLRPISIIGNSIIGDQHEGKGGGIYLSSGSGMNLGNVRISGNSARAAGAAIASNHNDTNLEAPFFSITRSDEGCEYDEICTTLMNNSTSENGYGDVISQENGGFGYVIQARVEGNGSPSSESLFKTNGGSQLILISDLIVSNSTSINMFDQQDGSEVYVQYSTLSDNSVGNYFNVQYDNNTPQILGVTGTIIKNGDATIANLNIDQGNHNAEVNCSLVESDDASGVVQNQSIFGVPDFIGNGNYKLKPDSIAIDSNCTEIGEFDLARYDIRNQDRSEDGMADLGAYERIDSDDVIFANNFE